MLDRADARTLLKTVEEYETVEVVVSKEEYFALRNLGIPRREVLEWDGKVIRTDESTI